MCLWEKLYFIFFGNFRCGPKNDKGEDSSSSERRVRVLDRPRTSGSPRQTGLNNYRPRNETDISFITLQEKNSDRIFHDAATLESVTLNIKEFENESIKKPEQYQYETVSSGKHYDAGMSYNATTHSEDLYEVNLEEIQHDFGYSNLYLQLRGFNISKPEENDGKFSCREDDIYEVSEEISSTYDEENDHENESPLYLLPYEILHHIFSFISLPELCLNVSLVCKAWNSLINDPIHWQCLVFRTGITSENVTKCIEKAPYLKDLTLYWRTDLTSLDVHNFARHCPLLRKLHLPYCDNVDKDVIKILAENCIGLTLLNLEGCRLVDNECVPFICKLTKLKSLYLSHCAFIETRSIELLSKTLPHLQELNTDGIPDISDSAVEVLVGHHYTHLHMLCLDGASLTDAAFHQLSKCHSLKTLCVSFGERLSDRTLTYIKRIQSLQTLRLCKGGDFTSEGLVTLFSDKSLTNLVHLDLSDCLHLHDSGIHALVQSCGAKLKQLYLCWCWNISDVGLKDIVGNCPMLEVLDLMGVCDVGGNSLVLIPVTMPNLRVLDLSQCHQVTDELLVDVVQQLPQLVVFNYYGEKIAYCPRSGQRVHRFHSSLVTR